MHKEQQTQYAQDYENALKEQLRAAEIRSLSNKGDGSNSLYRFAHHHNHHSRKLSGDAEEASRFVSGEYFKKVDMTKKAVEESKKK